MRKKSPPIWTWLSFLLILHPSESLTIDNNNNNKNCSVANMKIVCDEEGKNHNPFCSQKMSMNCDVNKVCFDSRGEKMKNTVCSSSDYDSEVECGSIEPNNITHPEDSLIHIHLYSHTSNFGAEALVNLTLPNPTWNKLDLQYAVMDGTYHDSCLFYTLAQPVNTTLMYDCHIKEKFKDEFMNVKLSVKADNGKGASYIFKVPEGYRVEPQETCPTDWHTFFYIQQQPQPNDTLPVTIQSSPYGQVTYSIELARCLDEMCDQFDVVEHQLVTKNTSDDLWTVYLPTLNTSGGNHTVRVQLLISSDGLSSKTYSSYVSVSPIFVLAPTSTWIVIIMSIISIFMLICTVLDLLYQYQKYIKEFYRVIKNKPPTLLLVYHPESQAAFHFVTILAEFLRKTCCVTPLMVDKAVGNENPTIWTKRQMKDAKRVLFIIPQDSEAESVTPMRQQWQAAVTHCSGYEFINNPKNAKRLATLVHLTSADVPIEIRDKRCFKLTHNPAALANWIHGGSYLDQIFLWLPRIRINKKINPTWMHVKVAAVITQSCISPETPYPPVNVEIQQQFDGEYSNDDDDAYNEQYKMRPKSQVSLDNSSDDDGIFK